MYQPPELPPTSGPTSSSSPIPPAPARTPTPWDPEPSAFGGPRDPDSVAASHRPDPAPVRRSRRLPAGAVLAIVSLASALIASSLTAIVLVPSLPSSRPAASPVPRASGAVGTTVSTVPVGSSGNAVVAVARSATPAVVTISSAIDGAGAFGGTATGTGSGFVYDANGLILTNDHVVVGATTILVTLLDGRRFPATVVEADPDHDLAIVKIDASGLPALALGTADQLAVGEPLVVIGNPLGTYTGSVTSGILSATDRSITVTDELTRRPRTLTGLLQTDAAVNPGNSGGPILDLAGNVVGIATATSTSAQGLGFGVPISAVVELVAKAKSTAS